MELPKFIRDGAFNWSAQGYHYSLGEAERRRIDDGDTEADPWLDIARVVERAKAGDFGEAGALSRYFTTDLETNAAPAAMLITGDLGRRSDLQALCEVMRRGPDGLRVYACQGARNAGELWLVPHMLDAWHRAESVDAHENIGYAIADLLDPIEDLDEEGEVGARAGRFTIPTGRKPEDDPLEQLGRRTSPLGASGEFNDLVKRRFDEMAEACGSDQVAVWAGAATGVAALAEHYLKMITVESFTPLQAPLTVAMREKFEASTGRDCSDFYREGRFYQLGAVAGLEDFIDTTPADRFAPGKRYFFGHPIPD